MSEKDINNLKEMLVDFNEYSTDYTKTRCKELEETIENTLEEIERLNNIINELEKKLLELRLTDVDGKTIVYRLLNKLQELKGSNEPSFEEMVGFVENVYKDIKSQSTLHEELEEERKTIAKIVGDFKEINK